MIQKEGTSSLSSGGLSKQDKLSTVSLETCKHPSPRQAPLGGEGARGGEDGVTRSFTRIHPERNEDSNYNETVCFMLSNTGALHGKEAS